MADSKISYSDSLTNDVSVIDRGLKENAISPRSNQPYYKTNEYLDDYKALNNSYKPRKSVGVNEITVIDKDWIANQAICPVASLSQQHVIEMFASNADYKLQDTMLGGNECINPRPQWTRYADIRADNLLVKAFNSNVTKDDTSIANVSIHDSTARHGMGRAYSEVIDDNKQLLYLQFGIPKFNGILNFLRNNVNYVDLYIARYGRMPRFYNAARAVGIAIRWINMFTTSVVVFLFSTGLDLLMGKKPFQYYYLDPQMHTYWGSVNLIANQIATNLGILNRYYSKATDKFNKELAKNVKGRAFTISHDDIARINELLGIPCIDYNTGYINVYGIAVMYQVRINSMFLGYVELRNSNPNNLFTKLSNSGDTKLSNDMSPDNQLALDAKNALDARYKLSTFYQNLKNMEATGSFFNLNVALMSSPSDLRDTAKTLTKLAPAEPDKISADEAKNTKKESNTSNNITPNQNSDGNDGKSSNSTKNTFGQDQYYTKIGAPADDTNQKYPHAMAKIAETKSGTSDGSNIVATGLTVGRQVLDATLRGGYLFAVLAVNHTGSTSESISNSTGELPLSDKFKSAQRAVKQFNLGADSLVGDTPILKDLLDAATQVGNGLLDGLTADFSSVVRSALSGAYANIPKIWEDSDTSLSDMSFTMDLVTPYGNDYSRFQNIVLPLAMILAGALPQSVGNNAYTSPFICSAFMRGKRHIKLGIISSVSITRGTTNLPYMYNMKTNGIQIQFTVTDLGTMVASPQPTQVFLDLEGLALESDTPFADYLESIAAMDIYDITYKWPRIKQRTSSILKNYANALNASRYTSWLGNLLEGSPLGLMVGERSARFNRR